MKAGRKRLALMTAVLTLFAATPGRLPAAQQYDVEPAEVTPAKRSAVEWLESNRDRFISLSDRIWRTPETSLLEVEASAMLARDLAAMQAEWKGKTKSIEYESAIPEGQRPPQL